MEKLVRVFYLKDKFKEESVQNLINNFDFSKYAQVCSIFVSSNDKDIKLLDEIYKMFNWTYNNFKIDDPFTEFKKSDEVSHINLNTGDVVRISTNYYIKTQSGWEKFELYQESRIVSEKTKPTNNNLPKPQKEVSQKMNQIPQNTNHNINIDDIITIIGTTVNKKGVPTVILQGRKAKVVGFGKGDKLKVILIDKNGKLQNCVINVKLNEVYKEEELKVV
jgi:hypothetical protein